MLTTYFAIIGTSRNACGEVRWTLTARNSEANIINLAADECRYSGNMLERLAGLAWIDINPPKAGKPEIFKPAHPFTPEEELQAALIKLNDDGRTYIIFDDSKPEEVEDFLDYADDIGLDKKAQMLVEKFPSTKGN